MNSHNAAARAMSDHYFGVDHWDAIEQWQRDAFVDQIAPIAPMFAELDTLKAIDLATGSALRAHTKSLAARVRELESRSDPR